MSKCRIGVRADIVNTALRPLEDKGYIDSNRGSGRNTTYVALNEKGRKNESAVNSVIAGVNKDFSNLQSRILERGSDPNLISVTIDENTISLYRAHYKNDIEGKTIAEYKPNIYFKNTGETKSLSSILKTISENGSNNSFNALAKIYLDQINKGRIEDIQVELQEHDDLIESYEDSNGVYDPIFKKIILSNNLRDTAIIERVLLHEATHHLTLKGLKYNAEFKRRINSLMTRVKNLVKEDKLNSNIYGLMSEEEFLAEALTNTQLQDLLKRLPSLNGKTSLFNDFIRFIKDFIRSVTGAQPTALDELLDTTFTYISGKMLQDAEAESSEGLEVAYSKGPTENLTVEQMVNMFSRSQSMIYRDVVRNEESGMEEHIYRIKNNDKTLKSATYFSKLKFKQKHPDFTPSKEQEAVREAGDLAHAIIAHVVKDAFPEANQHVESLSTQQLEDNKKHVAALKKQFQPLIDEYTKKKGVLMAEVMVTASNLNRGGTLDLVGITKKGVDIFDTKTRGAKNIHHRKLDEWSIQLGIYKNILENGDLLIGNKPVKVNKTRVIPVRSIFNMNKNIQGSLKEFKVDLTEDKKIDYYPVAFEKTGIKELDDLLVKLNSELEAIQAKKVPAEQREKHYERIAKKREAIKNLQVERSVTALAAAGIIELEAIEEIMDSDTFDINEDYKELQDTLFLYKNIMSYIPEKEFKKLTSTKTKKRLKELQRLSADAAVLYKRFNILSDEVLRGTVKDKTNIVGQNNVEDIGDVFDAQLETNIWHRYLMGISYTNHPLIQSTRQLTMQALARSEDNSVKLIDKIKKSIKDLEAYYGTSGLSIYKDLFELDAQGNATGSLIREYSVEYYKEAYKRKANKDFEWFKNNADFDLEKYEAAKKRFTDMVKSKEVYEKARIKKNFEEAAKKKGKTYKKTNEAVQKAWDKYLQDKVDEWVKTNKEITKYNKPKDQWRNQMYTNLKHGSLKGTAVEKFYDLYTETIEEISEYAPQLLFKNFVPNFKADLLEKVQLKGILTIPNSKKNSLARIVDGMTVGSEPDAYGRISQATGLPINEMNISGLDNLDVSEKSFDLGKSLALFAESAYRYKELSAIENVVLMSLNHVANKEQIILDSTGKPVKTEYGTDKTNKGSVNTYEQYKDWIDTIFYNKKTAGESGFTYTVGKKGAKLGIGKEGEVKKISLTKVGNKILGYTAIRNLGLNLFAPVTNLLGGGANLVMQAAGGRFFGMKNFSKAAVMIAAGPTGITEDARKAHLFMKKFNVAFNEFSREAGKEVSVVKGSKIANTDNLFALMRVGEDVVANTALIATLLEGKSGIKFEDYSISEDGESLVYTGDPKNKPTAEQETLFKLKVQKINKIVLGNLDPNDNMAAKKWFLGRALLQHRGWIPSMFNERFGARKYDYDLGEEIGGRYKLLAKKTAWNYLKMFAMDTLSGNFGRIELTEENLAKYNLTKEDVADMRANMMEMALILGTMALLAALKGDDDDKERRKRLAYLIRIADRLYNELIFFIPILGTKAQYAILQSPAATMGTVENAGKLLEELWKYFTTDEETEVAKKTIKMVPVASQVYRFEQELSRAED